jgi:hypothetical protein
MTAASVPPVVDLRPSPRADRRAQQMAYINGLLERFHDSCSVASTRFHSEFYEVFRRLLAGFPLDRK